MVRINCPDCDRSLNIPETAIGKTGRCPGCNHRFVVSVPSIAEPVEENWLDPEQETSEPWPAAPTARKKHQKKKEPERVQKSVQFWTRGKLLGAGAVSIVLLVGMIAAVWILSGSRGGGPGGNNVAREPKHDPTSFNGDNSSTVYLREAPAADPKTWKVTVEKAENAPANLKAIVPVPVIEGQAVIAFALSDPKSAAAAIVLDRSGGNAVPWLQVSLTDPAATKLVSLSDADRPYDLPQGKNDVALSPFGERLTTFFKGRERGAKNGVVVWNRDGTKHKVFTLGEYSGEESKCHGIWFLGEDLFLVHVEQTLYCCDISTGTTIYERPLDLLGDATLSAKRTWLFASVEGGIEVIATVDGTLAGRIDIPGIAKGGGTFMAISLDGTKLAAVPFCETGLPLMIWTIADGKPTSTVVRHLNVRSKWKANNVKPGGIEPLSLHWIEGDRLLLDGRTIYETELGGSIYEFGENKSRSNDGGTRPPDGRAWRLMAPQPAAAKGFSDAFPGSTGIYIVASVVPPLPTDMLCMPMTSYRVEVEGTGWDSTAVRESLADGLAEHGLRIDPKAELTAVFTGQSITKQQVPAGKEVNPKWNEQLLPGQTLRELVDGYETKYEIEIRNRRGDVVWKTGSRTCTVTDTKGEGKMRGWKRATDEAAGLIPVGPTLLNAGRAPSKLPLMLLTDSDGSVK